MGSSVMRSAALMWERECRFLRPVEAGVLLGLVWIADSGAFGHGGTIRAEVTAVTAAIETDRETLVDALDGLSKRGKVKYEIRDGLAEVRVRMWFSSAERAREKKRARERDRRIALKEGSGFRSVAGAGCRASSVD